jgi:hypothetical protein
LARGDRLLGAARWVLGAGCWGLFGEPATVRRQQREYGRKQKKKPEQGSPIPGRLPNVAAWREIHTLPFYFISGPGWATTSERRLIVSWCHRLIFAS